MILWGKPEDLLAAVESAQKLSVEFCAEGEALRNMEDPYVS